MVQAVRAGADRQTVLIDARGHRTTWAYDDAGRRINEIDADGGVSTYGYDAVGNVTLTVDPRGAWSHKSYDGVNRLRAELFSDGVRHTFTYDEVGNRRTMQDPTGTTITTYTVRNEVEAVAVPSGKTVTYSYDAAGRREWMAAYGEGTFTYGYDDAGRQTRVTNPKNRITTTEYDPLGRMRERRNGPCAVTTQSYDPAGNLEQITNRGAEGALVSQLTYTFDKSNHKRTQVENDGTVTTWTYDEVYQLENEHRSGGPAEGGGRRSPRVNTTRWGGVYPPPAPPWEGGESRAYCGCCLCSWGCLTPRGGAVTTPAL